MTSRAQEDEDGIRVLTPHPANIQNSTDHTPDDDPEAHESTPLLGRETSADVDQNASTFRRKRSWWTILSIIILLIITVNIIIFAFLVPSSTQSYATQATTYSLQNVEVEDYTDTGFVATAQVNVTIDASRVSSKGTRNLGLFATSIFKHVYTEPCNVTILLPQYNGVQVAFANLPALTLDVRNQHVNLLNITSNVTITDEAVAVQLVGDYLAGRRHEIETIGETDIHIKAGIIPLGRHHVRQEIVVRGR
jgi:hypothetical protein